MVGPTTTPAVSKHNNRQTSVSAEFVEQPEEERAVQKKNAGDRKKGNPQHLAKNSLEHVCGETTQGWRKVPSKKIRRKSAQHSFKAGKCPDKLEKLLIHRALGRILRKVFTSVMGK